MNGIKLTGVCVLACVALGWSASTFAGAWAGSATNSEPRKHDELITGSSTFLEGHPDLRHRNHGITAFRAGEYLDAQRHFMRAAHFADKPSQAVYAEMLWDGIGVVQDRALAYAWMDLAAERGMPVFVGKRESYWGQLGEAERARALELGKTVYAEYGDDVAKPRQERLMRVARRNVTGSRVGMIGALTIEFPGPGGGHVIDGEQLYADELWVPERYWAWQEATTERALRTTIHVGDFEQSQQPRPAGD